ncbi:MAG: efflux RND transporter periplasmic adaptor subunit, partial [Saprospiraceae bacterium]|nr:efflux RND transporter periplasmic adaptor subunit [Saprospiraceae bacterium]
MKYLILALLPAAVLWHGCQPGNAGSAEIPESPEARLALLKEKRIQHGQLEKEIAELETLVGEAALAGREEKPKLVTSLVVQPVTFRRYSEIQGNVTPVRMNAISSETGGRLTKVLVRTGDEVKAGQLLATVDMEPLQKQLQEVEAAWQLAKDVHDRQKRLWDQQIGSEIQYLQAKNNLERLDKSMESLRSQIRKGSIMAPISGVIEELHYEQGDVAPPGMPIMQLINTRDLKIVAEVPERFVGTVREGDKVRIRIPVLNTEQEARILTVGRMIHPSNRTFRLETTLDNRKGIFKPN